MSIIIPEYINNKLIILCCQEYLHPYCIAFVIAGTLMHNAPPPSFSFASITLVEIFLKVYEESAIIIAINLKKKNTNK